MVNRFAPTANRFSGTSGFGKVAQGAGALLGQYLSKPGATATAPAPRMNYNRSQGYTPFGRGSSGGGFGSAISSSPRSGFLTDRSSTSFGIASDISARADEIRGLTQSSDFYSGFKPGGGGGGSQATYTPNFGQFTPDVDPEINAAAAKYGVPANFLKTIIAKESSGRWGGSNTRPVWVPSHSPSMGHILGYVGVFKAAADTRGLGHLWQAGAQGNRQAQIELLAGVLASQLRDVQKRDPSYGWLNVAAYHYSGDPSGNTDPPGWEKHGRTRDYMQKTANWWAQLEPNFNAAGGGGGGGGLTSGATPGQASGAVSTVWGGQGQKNLNYGFGAKNSLGLYKYGINYGMNGYDHTGIDIPQNIGDPVYSPVSGTVVCSCTGSGGGCSSFNDYMGKGCGRIEIETPQGHRVILGHTSTSNVQIGQQVSVGGQVGTSGGMNGGHTHLEYRVPDGSMPNSYRLVDPSQYLGGTGVPGVPSGPGAAPAEPPRPMMGWERRSYGGGARSSISSWRT